MSSSFSVLSAETSIDVKDLKECRRESPKPPQQDQSRVAIPRKGPHSRNQYKSSLKEQCSKDFAFEPLYSGQTSQCETTPIWLLEREEI